MRIITKIIKVEKRIKVSRLGHYYATIAQLDDGSEVSGYGDGFVVGDEVEVYFHDKFGYSKMAKKKPYNGIFKVK